MTDTTGWARIEAVFHDVAEIGEADAREARLVERCRGDGALLATVRALLDEDVRLGAAAHRADPHVGQRLGSFCIDGVIARGGMATVYVGHRDDGAFDQRVAVKIMDVRLADPALVLRFKAERQILARLEHPAITRLLDGGVTPAGEPYLVMEFVDGQPLDRYCDARQLDVAARIRLFSTVCEGVWYAHRALVLHRDLKPSNILVTNDGHPKIVDFGTATLLEPDRVTTVSRAPLTPAYASPEQLTDRAVGTASDQYSLGLVLYELLAGARPFGERTSLISAMERTLAGVPPAPIHATVTAEAAALRKTSPRWLQRHLQGELGTIVAKAMAEEPTDRYQSVAHLADDLTRYRAGEPILARTPTWSYHARRFVGRHRIAVTVASVLLAGVTAATAFAIAQAGIAQRESQKAPRLNRLLTQVLTSTSPLLIATANSEGKARAVAQLDDAARTILADPELAGAPDVEMAIRTTLGNLYRSFDRPAAAVEHLTRARELAEAQGDRRSRARVLLDLGRALVLASRPVEAEHTFRAALDAFGTDADGEDAVNRIDAMMHLATVIHGQRLRDPEGTALMRTAIRLGAPLSWPRLHNARSSLGLQLLFEGRLDEAEAVFAEAMRETSTLPNTDDRAYSVRASYSALMRAQGNAAEALRWASDAYDGATARGNVPLSSGVRPGIGLHTHVLGRALALAGRLPEARMALLDAARILRDENPLSPNVGRPLAVLGEVYRREGHFRDAERVLLEARRAMADVAVLVEPFADATRELGLTYEAMGRQDEGRALLRESHELFKSAFGASHPWTMRARAHLEAATAADALRSRRRLARTP